MICLRTAIQRILSQEPGPVQLLRQLTGGQFKIQLNGSAIVQVDATARDLEMDVTPIAELAADRGKGPSMGLREGLALARGLAKAEWRIRIRKGPHDLATLGRGVSALTGHVSVTPRGLREFWRSR